MKLFFAKKDKKAITRSLAGLAVNLSAGWFGLVLIAPNFWPLDGLKGLGFLTLDVFAGTLFLWVSYKLERNLL
ncbi:MAG: hypothetical protein ABH814_03105 [bacterium]